MDAGLEISKSWLKNPQEFLSRLTRYNMALYSIFFEYFLRTIGQENPKVLPKQKWDQRFREDIWYENDFLHAWMEVYLLNDKWFHLMIMETPGVSDEIKLRFAYWMRQFLIAYSPTNFFFSNPFAVRKVLDSSGRTFFKSFKNFLNDLKHGQLPPLVDMERFKVGVNLALSRGKVIFRNNLLELIHYEPKKQNVREIPILFIPAWINKYYILDLTPKMSMVNYLLENGFNVYMISWKNATSDMRNISFENYLIDGALQTTLQVMEHSGSKSVHPVGYCVGVILLTTLMAYINHPEEKNYRDIIKSWTLLATLVDFSNPGDIKSFLANRAIEYLEDLMEKQGYLDGKYMFNTFRFLRSDSLVWRVARERYLYGEDPSHLEVFYWNSDNTRIPKKTHSFFLRQFYKSNNLCTNKLSINGRLLDLSNISVPLYCVATEDDHIAPWKEIFKVGKYVNSDVQYTLSSSGHVLGIVNPPDKNSKNFYWTNKIQKNQTSGEWIASAIKREGSWWLDWCNWLFSKLGNEIEFEKIKKNDKDCIDAPGQYVLE